MLKIRSIWKATELKKFKELEEKFHYMGETHSGGDTLRLIGAMLLARTPVFFFLAQSGMKNAQEFKEEMQRDYDKARALLLKSQPN